MDFPAIYYFSPAAFAVHVDNTDITNLEDLNGRVIGTGVGSSYADYLNQELDMSIVGMPPVAAQIVPGTVELYSTEIIAFESLGNGDGVEIDAAIGNIRSILDFVTAGAPLRAIGQPVFLEPLAIAVDDNDPEFAQRIADVIAEMHADGTLAQLSFDWFDTDLTAQQ